MASRLVADIVRDFEPELSSLIVRTFDDGRFVVLVNGETLYDKNREGRFPNYADDIRQGLASKI
jgi:predicted Rdx family selenoprotein